MLGWAVAGAAAAWGLQWSGLAAAAGVPAAIEVAGYSVSRMWPLSVGLTAAFAVVARLTRGRKQPVTGAVFVTGCDSGMGEVTALHLAKLGFHVFAGIYSEASVAKLQEQAKAAGCPQNLTPVVCDVTKTDSIVNAAAFVEKALANHPPGLVALIQCAGAGFTGPIEYFNMQLYRQQMDINFFGYVEVCQVFLPLLKAAALKPGGRRGRIVFTGTGGGVMSPAPALLSAYMASKWAGEAFMQCLRMEMRLRKLPIDACMVNPGFIKPTALMAGGKVLLEKMWNAVPNGKSQQARDEYEGLVGKFLAYSEAQPGTHVRYIALAMEQAMTAPTPLTSYKVGPDSKAAPFVGMLPPAVREFIVATSMFS